MSVFRFLRDKKGVIYVETFYALLVVTVIGLAVYFIWQWRFSSEERSVEQAARSYLQAMATGDLAAAREVSEGRAAEAAGKLEGKNLAARVDEVSTSVQALGRGWARVKATVELTLQDGTADVGWYELELLKGGEAWKVYSFRETGPRIEGRCIGRPGMEELREAEAVFKGYLDDLAAGRYKEAARWLAGPAFREHLAASDVLGRGELLDVVGDLSLTPLAQDGKLLIARCDYRVGEKETSMVATFYRTAQGWRVVQVTKYDL